MQKDAESHADEDKERRELADARNQAEAMCFQLEKLIKENDEKLQESDKEPLAKAIEKTRETAKGDDTQAIKSTIGELEQASHALSEILYKSAQPEGAADADPESPQADAPSGRRRWQGR